MENQNQDNKLKNQIKEMLIIADPSIIQTGIIQTYSLQKILNEMGIQLFASEIDELILRLDPHKLGNMPQDKLIEVIHMLLTGFNISELEQSLQKISNDKTQKISIPDFKYLMENFGDPLSQEEHDKLFEMIKEIDEKGQFNYKLLIDKLNK